MDKEKVIDFLNQAISLEYQAYMQYFYQSLKLRGVSTMALKQLLAKEADIELGHSKTLAAQVACMGGTPTFEINPPEIGDTAQDMIKNNIKREEMAIKLYRQILTLVGEDEQLYEIIRQILQDELGDMDEFKLLIE